MITLSVDHSVDSYPPKQGETTGSVSPFCSSPASEFSLEQSDLARGVPQFLGTAGMGRFGGELGCASEHWVIEGVLYMIVMGSVYGAIIGVASENLLNAAPKRLLSFRVGYNSC